MSQSRTEPAAATVGPARRALPRGFYARSPLDVAPDLVGAVLVRETPGGRLAARIVEVEAYDGSRDPASHAFRGETARNRVMFGAPGHAYVYFIYGMHHCVNVVCRPRGEAGAVLIRAAAVLDGRGAMRRRRAGASDVALLRGPGCLARAFGLTRAADGADLTRPPLWIAPRTVAPPRILAGPRVGIRHASDRAWRFWWEGAPEVSGSRRATRGAGVVVDTPGGGS